jgi:outer membrane protein
MKRFNLFKAVLLLLFFLLWPLKILAGEAKPPLRLSLEQALQMAKEQQVQVLVAKERVQQAITRIVQARSALLPQLQGTASQVRQTVNLEALGIFVNVPGFHTFVGPFNTFDARASLTQTLFDATALKRLQAAKTDRHLSEVELAKAQEDAMALVANLYLDADRAEEEWHLVQALQVRDGALLRIARDRLALGLGSAIEVTQAEASWAESKNQVEQARAQKEERRLDLASAIGLPDDQPIEFTLQKNSEKTPLPSEDTIHQSLDLHPEVVVAKNMVQQQMQQRKVEKSEYWPKFSGQANYGFSGTNPGNLDGTYLYGGQMNVPIYQGGLRQARIQEATSRIHESEAQLEDTKRQQQAKAFSALESLKQSFVGLKAANTELTRTSEELNLAEHRFQSGLGSEIEVVESRTQQALAQNQQSEALSLYRLAWVNLAHALGDTEKWLKELNQP